MVEMDMLGPLVLRSDGAVLSLGIKKVQALLLLLALDGPVSRARLCVMFWPDIPETSARRNLRRELVRLRESGASAAVVVEGDLLCPAPTLATDLQRAEAALAQGEPDAALLLWRGPLAQGLVMDEAPAFEPWLAAVRLRAQRLRQRALEASAAAHETRGDTVTALLRVQALLAEDSLNEGHHRDAMRLLAASGQRAAALRQFEDCQAVLAAELGLQPMAQTVALAEMLRGDPGAAVSAPALPSLPAAARMPPSWPAQLPFVGRSAEVARLQAGWAARATLLVAGEAGVGKSRLVVDFASAQGPYALVRCRPGDRELAFGAFARALRVLAGQPPDLRGLPAWVVAELARLLPELGSAPPPLQSEGERLRFDEACIQAWHTLAAESFDAVVLDDWQFADAASRALLVRVAARRRESGVPGAIELLAWRSEGAQGDEARSVAEEAEAVRVVLEPLPPGAVYELVQQLSGAADPARFADRLARATGGNAYFIAETLRDLAESAVLGVGADGRWHTPYDDVTQDYRELPMAPSVRDAVLARVQRLGAAAGRLLEAAALAGEPFGAALLASACALSEAEALAALEQAAQAQIVRAHEEGGYGWVHDLARQALDSALAPTRRRLMHHRLALAAEALGGSAAAALHFEACGEPARAVAHRLAAGDAARGLQALAEAARHWRQGLADQPTSGQTAALLARLLDTEFSLGRAAEADAGRARLEALLASGALPPDEHAEAALRLAAYLARSERAQAALEVLDFITPVAAGSLRQRCLGVRVGALHELGRVDEAMAAGVEALALAPTASRDRGDVLAMLSFVERTAGRLGAAVERINEFIALCTQLGNDLGLARGRYYRGCFHSELGAHGAAEVDLREAATLAARFGNRVIQRLALYNLATNFTSQTRADEALVVTREGWALAEGQPIDDIQVMFRTMFVEAHYVRGEWGLAWSHAGQAVDEALRLGHPMVMAGVASAALEPLAVLGQWPRALPLVQALDGDTLAQAPEAGHDVWLSCAQAALLRGDTAAAAGWLARLGPAGDIEHQRVRRRLAVLTAELHWATGHSADALALLPADDAPAMNDELRLRALALRCRLGPEPALRDRARQALADPRAHAGAALAVERALGGAGLATRVAALAEGLAPWPEVQAGFLAAWR